MASPPLHKGHPSFQHSPRTSCPSSLPPPPVSPPHTAPTTRDDCFAACPFFQDSFHSAKAPPGPHWSSPKPVSPAPPSPSSSNAAKYAAHHHPSTMTDNN